MLEGIADILKAVSALLWPAVIVSIGYIFKPSILKILSRDNLTIKIGGVEVSLTEIAVSNGKNVVDIQQKLSELEKRLNDISGGQPEKAEESKVVKIMAEEIENRILWVDDFPSNNAFLIQKFREEGIRIDLCLDTESAMNYLKIGRYDLVITDLGRKEGGVNNPFAGIDLIRNIRNIPSDIPVIVFAGPRGIQNRKNIIAAGADAVTDNGVDVISFVTEHIHRK